jgi:hypothetical protein
MLPPLQLNAAVAGVEQAATAATNSHFAAGVCEGHLLLLLLLLLWCSHADWQCWTSGKSCCCFVVNTPLLLLLLLLLLHLRKQQVGQLLTCQLLESCHHLLLALPLLGTTCSTQTQLSSQQKRCGSSISDLV